MVKKISKKQLRSAGFFIKNNSLRSALAVFTLGVSAGIAYEETIGIGTWHSYHASTDIFNVCFTPPSGCGALVAQQIAQSRKSVYVQAFDFTSDHIAREIIKAHQRGVKVKVLVDRMSRESNNSQIPHLLAAGIEVAVDKVPGYAHNKVMIIDRQKVLTGSFNFTHGADKKNAENLILIDDTNIAEEYINNWSKRRASSTPITTSRVLD